MKYTNKKNETATITAKIKNQAVRNVELKKENHLTFTNWIIILISAILILIATKVYWKYKPKRKIETITNPIQQKPYNYRSASKKLLTKSKKLFLLKQHKDAYESASQAIRLFLSYKNSLRKEITNDEIIKHLKRKGEDTSKLKETLDTCSLVEFAKYSPNKSDFNKIISFAENLIK